MLSTKPWRIETTLLCGAGLFTCICLGAIVGELLRRAGVAGFRHPDDFGPLLIGTLCVQGISWPLILFFLHEHHLRPGDAFGLRGPNLKRAISLAALVALLILPIAWLLQSLSLEVLIKVGIEPQNQMAVTAMENAHALWLQIYLGLFAVVIAPVAEEFIFRGILYPLVKQAGFPRFAAIGVSLLFAAIHFDAGTFLPLFVLALAFTWLYEATDNLLAPIVAHALFNGANLLRLVQMQHQLAPLAQ